MNETLDFAKAWLDELAAEIICMEFGERRVWLQRRYDLLNEFISSVLVTPEHLQAAPRTQRNAFDVPDPGNLKKTIRVVFESFAVCLEREVNQIRVVSS